MSTLYVDTITEKTAGNGVHIAGHVVQVYKYNFYTRVAVSTTTATTVYTGTNITLSSSANKVLFTGHFSLGWSFGGALKLQYTTDNGSNWNNIKTAEMNDTDNGSGMDGVSH